MADVVAAPPVAVARDRRAGLVVFGVAQILIGIICAGLALGVAASAEIATRQGIPGAGAAVAAGMVLWGLAAVYFVVAGIGSIRARRWAQALSVAVSAVWLAGGIVATLMIAIILPHAMRQYASTDATFAAGVSAITALVGFILLPLGLFLFYRSPATRLTCERLDGKRRWTDRVPRPVLAVIVVMAFTSVALIANVGNPVMPFMGKVVTGPPAALTFFGLAVLCAFVTVQLYRLKENAWWTLVLLQIAGVVIGVLTMIRTPAAPASVDGGLAQVYREPLVIALMIATWLAYFAFLMYLRRFFAIRLLPRTRRDD
jgi:MFS family permease